MIYFLTALYYEAKNIIEHYRMKKLIEVTKFQVFRGENEVLIISGVSGVKAVVAATYLLTRFKYSSQDIFINVGICGAVKDKGNIGEIFLCNKLIDSFSKKVFYPDILFKHPFREGILESFAEVVNETDRLNINADIVDLEGTFVYEAVELFFSPENIYIIKVVSDILNDNYVAPTLIESLMSDNMPNLYKWLEELIKFKSNHEDQDIINIREYKTLETLSQNMNLTAAMNIQLQKLSKQYKIRNGHVVDLISQYKGRQCDSKIEGKKVFHELKQRLMEL